MSESWLDITKRLRREIDARWGDTEMVTLDETVAYAKLVVALATAEQMAERGRSGVAKGALIRALVAEQDLSGQCHECGAPWERPQADSGVYCSNCGIAKPIPCTPLPEGAKGPDFKLCERCQSEHNKMCPACGSICKHTPPYQVFPPSLPDEPCERECDHDWRVLGLVRSVVCNDCGQPGTLPVGTAEESCKHEFMAYGSAYKVSDTCRKCGTRKESDNA